MYIIPDLQEELVDNAMNIFYRLRELKGIKKRPGTSELLDWIKLLTMETLQEGELKKCGFKNKIPAPHQCLVKKRARLGNALQS
jgi:MoxR-like ATPase